ncbi:hypothetical protein HK102_009831, partial [Quaeritorhiza haematococci]
MVDGLLDQGSGFFQSKNYDGAIQMWTEARKLAVKLGDMFREARAWNNLACVYRRKGEFALAAEALDNAWELAGKVFKAGVKKRRMREEGGTTRSSGGAAQSGLGADADLNGTALAPKPTTVKSKTLKVLGVTEAELQRADTSLTSLSLSLSAHSPDGSTTFKSGKKKSPTSARRGSDSDATSVSSFKKNLAIRRTTLRPRQATVGELTSQSEPDLTKLTRQLSPSAGSSNSTSKALRLLGAEAPDPVEEVGGAPTPTSIAGTPSSLHVSQSLKTLRHMASNSALGKTVRKVRTHTASIVPQMHGNQQPEPNDASSLGVGGGLGAGGLGGSVDDFPPKQRPIKSKAMRMLGISDNTHTSSPHPHHTASSNTPQNQIPSPPLPPSSSLPLSTSHIDSGGVTKHASPKALRLLGMDHHLAIKKKSSTKALRLLGVEAGAAISNKRRHAPVDDLTFVDDDDEDLEGVEGEFEGGYDMGMDDAMAYAAVGGGGGTSPHPGSIRSITPTGGPVTPSALSSSSSTTLSNGFLHPDHAYAYANSPSNTHPVYTPSTPTDASSIEATDALKPKPTLSESTGMGMGMNEEEYVAPPLSARGQRKSSIDSIFDAYSFEEGVEGVERAEGPEGRE